MRLGEQHNTDIFRHPDSSKALNFDGRFEWFDLVRADDRRQPFVRTRDCLARVHLYSACATQELSGGIGCRVKHRLFKTAVLAKCWWAHQDSNLGPAD